jgi:hypothetical protein
MRVSNFSSAKRPRWAQSILSQNLSSTIKDRHRKFA